MINLPIIKYDQKQVSATASWDSSSHDAIELTRVTGSNERVYLIVKVVVGLTSPVTMQLVLRKRICVRIYKKQSWKDSLLRRLTKDIRCSCGVVYELVSHIPRQPGEETEERASLAQMAAQAVGEEEEDETVLRRYSRGISNVESLLALDKLRQEVQVKEKLAAIGKPLRKFASTPNLAAATSDLSFGMGGSPGRFDSPETRFLDFKSYGMNSERANRSFSGREETLIDLKSFVTPPSQSSTPTSSGVVLRNSGGRQNPRPSSLIIDLETLSEDSKDTSPEVQIPDHFNFAGVKLEEPEVTKSPLPDDLRDRTASSDTIIFDDEGAMAYDDLPTPTPFQFMKGRSPDKSPVKTLDKTPEETTTPENKTPENEISVTTNSELIDIFSNQGKEAHSDFKANEIAKDESPLLDLGFTVEAEKEKVADSDFKANEVATNKNPLLDLNLTVESDKEKVADLDAKTNEIATDESPLLDLTLNVESEKDDTTKKDLTNDLISISNEMDQKSGTLTTTNPLSLGMDDLTSITTTTPLLPDIISPSKSDSEPKDFERNSEEDKYLLSTSRDDLSSFGSREDLASSLDSLDWNEASLGNLKPGMAVWLSEGKTGVIRFTGATEFAPGMWVGVELDKAGGRNDGSVQGVRYFACKPRFGSFVRPDKVTPIDHSARERSTSRKITGSRDNTSKTSSNRALNKTESTSRTSLVKGTAKRRTDSPGSGGRTDSPSRTSRTAAGRGDNATASPVTRRENAGANRKKDDWKRRSNILF